MTLWNDAAAGLTVGVMLIPQGMAYAVLAGVPPIYGLYGGLVPALVYPLFGTARQLANGPAALNMIIVSAGVGTLASSGRTATWP
jgi:SulP family sulfate permease